MLFVKVFCVCDFQMQPDDGCLGASAGKIKIRRNVAKAANEIARTYGVFVR